MWELIHKAVQASGAAELTVLYILIAFSITSWAVILLKVKTLLAAQRNNAKLLKLFNASDTIGEFTPPKGLTPAPLVAIFDAAVDTLENAGHSGVRHVKLSSEKLHEKVMQRMQHTSKEEMANMRWGSGYLASVGSASPFIGLFGTVWGIMATFQTLGNSASASLQVVAPGISSALIATAAGLAVAIPAVMAYNWIIARIEILQEDSDVFIERLDLLSRIEYGPVAEGAARKSPSNGDIALPTDVAIVGQGVPVSRERGV